MPTAFTPNLQLPYPEGSDPAAVPKDIKALADKLDGIVLPSANAQNLQPGDLIVSAAAARVGCLLCDGAPYDRVAYATLYAALGGAASPFGQGDGSTTFNVPDYRGRSLVGAGAGPGLTARALGAKGGEEAHALALAEIPSHGHTGATGVDSPDHTHGGYTSADSPDHSHATGRAINLSVAAGSYPYTFIAAPNDGSFYSAGASARHTHSTASYGASARHAHAITAEGGNGTHNNMQPYGTANVFIKT